MPKTKKDTPNFTQTMPNTGSSKIGTGAKNSLNLTQSVDARHTNRAGIAQESFESVIENTVIDKTICALMDDLFKRIKLNGNADPEIEDLKNESIADQLNYYTGRLDGVLEEDEDAANRYFFPLKEWWRDSKNTQLSGGDRKKELCLFLRQVVTKGGEIGKWLLRRFSDHVEHDAIRELSEQAALYYDSAISRTSAGSLSSVAALFYPFFSKLGDKKLDEGAQDALMLYHFLQQLKQEGQNVNKIIQNTIELFDAREAWLIQAEGRHELLKELLIHPQFLLENEDSGELLLSFFKIYSDYCDNYSRANSMPILTAAAMFRQLSPQNSDVRKFKSRLSILECLMPCVPKWVDIDEALSFIQRVNSQVEQEESIIDGAKSMVPYLLNSAYKHLLTEENGQEMLRELLQHSEFLLTKNPYFEPQVLRLHPELIQIEGQNRNGELFKIFITTYANNSAVKARFPKPVELFKLFFEDEGKNLPEADQLTFNYDNISLLFLVAEHAPHEANLADINKLVRALKGLTAKSIDGISRVLQESSDKELASKLLKSILNGNGSVLDLKIAVTFLNDCEMLRGWKMPSSVAERIIDRVREFGLADLAKNGLQESMHLSLWLSKLERVVSNADWGQMLAFMLAETKNGLDLLLDGDPSLINSRLESDPSTFDALKLAIDGLKMLQQQQQWRRLSSDQIDKVRSLFNNLLEAGLEICFTPDQRICDDRREELFCYWQILQLESYRKSDFDFGALLENIVQRLPECEEAISAIFKVLNAKKYESIVRFDRCDVLHILLKHCDDGSYDSANIAALLETYLDAYDAYRALRFNGLGAEEGHYSNFYPLKSAKEMLEDFFAEEGNSLTFKDNLEIFSYLARYMPYGLNAGAMARFINRENLQIQKGAAVSVSRVKEFLDLLDEAGFDEDDLRALRTELLDHPRFLLMDEGAFDTFKKFVEIYASDPKVRAVFAEPSALLKLFFETEWLTGPNLQLDENGLSLLTFVVHHVPEEVIEAEKIKELMRSLGGLEKSAIEKILQVLQRSANCREVMLKLLGFAANGHESVAEHLAIFIDECERLPPILSGRAIELGLHSLDKVDDWRDVRLPPVWFDNFQLVASDLSHLSYPNLEGMWASILALVDDTEQLKIWAADEPDLKIEEEHLKEVDEYLSKQPVVMDMLERLAILGRMEMERLEQGGLQTRPWESLEGRGKDENVGRELKDLLDEMRTLALEICSAPNYKEKSVELSCYNQILRLIEAVYSGRGFNQGSLSSVCKQLKQNLDKQLKEIRRSRGVGLFALDEAQIKEELARIEQVVDSQKTRQVIGDALAASRTYAKREVKSFIRDFQQSLTQSAEFDAENVETFCYELADLVAQIDQPLDMHPAFARVTGDGAEDGALLFLGLDMAGRASAKELGKLTMREFTNAQLIRYANRLAKLYQKNDNILAKTELMHEMVLTVAESCFRVFGTYPSLSQIASNLLYGQSNLTGSQLLLRVNGESNGASNITAAASVMLDYLTAKNGASSLFAKENDDLAVRDSRALAALATFFAAPIEQVRAGSLSDLNETVRAEADRSVVEFTAAGADRRKEDRPICSTKQSVQTLLQDAENILKRDKVGASCLVVDYKFKVQELADHLLQVREPSIAVRPIYIKKNSVWCREEGGLAQGFAEELTDEQIRERIAAGERFILLSTQEPFDGLEVKGLRTHFIDQEKNQHFAQVADLLVKNRERSEILFSGSAERAFDSVERYMQILRERPPKFDKPYYIFQKQKGNGRNDGYNIFRLDERGLVEQSSCLEEQFLPRIGEIRRQGGQVAVFTDVDARNRVGTDWGQAVLLDPVVDQHCFNQVADVTVEDGQVTPIYTAGDLVEQLNLENINIQTDWWRDRAVLDQVLQHTEAGAQVSHERQLTAKSSGKKKLTVLADTKLVVDSIISGLSSGAAQFIFGINHKWIKEDENIRQFIDACNAAIRYSQEKEITEDTKWELQKFALNKLLLTLASMDSATCACCLAALSLMCHDDSENSKMLRQWLFEAAGGNPERKPETELAYAVNMDRARFVALAACDNGVFKRVVKSLDQKKLPPEANLSSLREWMRQNYSKLTRARQQEVYKELSCNIRDVVQRAMDEASVPRELQDSARETCYGIIRGAMESGVFGLRDLTVHAANRTIVIKASSDLAMKCLQVNAPSYSDNGVRRFFQRHVGVKVKERRFFTSADTGMAVRTGNRARHLS